MTGIADLRFAWRMLRKRPGFTAVVIAALALGIGANATVFTLVNAVLFRGLPFANGPRILHLGTTVRGEGQGRRQLSLAELNELRSQAKSFEEVAGFESQTMNLSDLEASPERYSGARVTANLLTLTGEKPILGRIFTGSEDRRDAPLVAVLGYGPWQKRFGGRKDILGKTIRINEVPATIIGVMPQGFRFPVGEDLWTPLIPDDNLEKRTTRSIRGVAVLKEGLSVVQARAELQTISQRLASAWPDSNKEVVIIPQRYNDVFNGGPIRLVFLMLLGAVGFVLLIACANVANLLLSQSMSRTREVAIRAAMGAGRWQIVRQLLIESILLGVLGGVAGLLIGVWGIRAFDLAVTDVGKPYWIIFKMDWVVFTYLTVICVGTSILFGSAPAWQLARTAVNSSLKESGRNISAGARTRWLSGSLVVGEIALALVLLAGAGLMIRTFLKTYEVNAGIPASKILSMRLQLPSTKYKTDEQRISFWDQLMRRFRAVPGVEAASLTASLPLQGGFGWFVQLEGHPVPDNSKFPRSTGLVVEPDYFRTMGQPLTRGRDFVETDGKPGREVAIINQSFAAKFFPNQDPIGRRLRLPDPDSKTERPWLTVIGVCPDIVQSFPERDSDATIYVSNRQDVLRGAAIIVRTAVPPASMAAAFRKEVAEVDRDMPVFDVKTLVEAADQQRWAFRVFGTLFTVFALVALVLASVGIYGVMAYAVSERTQEFGVRLALGASGGSILAIVFKQGLARLALGLAIGLGIALAVTRLMKGLIAITPNDPVTFLSISLVLCLASGLACWLPARRAMRVDPLVALRNE